MNTQPAVATINSGAAQAEQADLPMVATSSAALVLDSNSMDNMMRLADTMASGRCTVPTHLRSSPGDCLAIIMQSVQWRMNPFAVAQKTHLVNGILGYEAQLVNAVINTMAPTKDRIHYEWYGDWSKVIGKFEIKTSNKDGKTSEYRVPGWKLDDEEGLGIRVWATLKGETEPRELELLLAQARTRNSPLWADDPRQQLAYLAVKRWSRLYTPDVILGVYTQDELEEDSTRVEREINPIGNAAQSGGKAKGDVYDPKKEERRAGLITALEAFAQKGEQAFVAEWKKIGKANKQDIYLVGEAEYMRMLAIAQAVQPPQEKEIDDPFVAEMTSAEKAGAGPAEEGQDE